MKSIREIILEECLPQRDCMLTLQDVKGEVGFLYFKDAELIEANYSAHWGKDAVEQVLDWQLAEHSVSPLPLGIKRSVWDSIEVVLRLNAATKAAAAPTVLNARKIEAAPTPYDHFKEMEGVAKIFLVEAQKENVIHEIENEPSEETGWMVEFCQRAKAVGDTLGFGALQRWTVLTDRYQVVGLSQPKEKAFLGLLRKHDVGTDDFEAACKASIPKEEE